MVLNEVAIRQAAEDGPLPLKPIRRQGKSSEQPCKSPPPARRTYRVEAEPRATPGFHKLAQLFIGMAARADAERASQEMTAIEPGMRPRRQNQTCTGPAGHALRGRGASPVHLRGLPRRSTWSSPNVFQRVVTK